MIAILIIQHERIQKPIPLLQRERERKKLIKTFIDRLMSVYITSQKQASPLFMAKARERREELIL